MGAEHTPGPWEAKEQQRRDLKGYVVVAHDLVVGEIIVSEAFPSPRLVAISEANANLIAAAPDLLALAVRVGCQDYDGACGENFPDGLCFVCRAIAKAEGRES